MAPTLKTLASFVSGEGVGPAAPSFGVILNPVTGDLYGTSDAGGVNSAGALFRVALIDGAYSTSPTVVLSDGGDQSIGLDYLVADAAGNVYDANSDGGPANAGILIKIAPDGTRPRCRHQGGYRVTSAPVTPSILRATRSGSADRAAKPRCSRSTATAARKPPSPPRLQATTTSWLEPPGRYL